MEKVKACESANSPPMHPSTYKPMAVRRNDGASTNNYQVPPQAVSSSAAGGNQEFVVQGEGTHPSNRMPSDDMHHVPPQWTAEDMAKLFKNPQQQQQQPAHYKPPVDISEQQQIEEDRERQTEEELSKSEQETDKILQDLEHTRQKAPLRPPPSNSAPGSPKPSCIKSQASQDDELEESGENLDNDRPYDPNLVCPKCGKQYRVGGIQKMKRHILKCTNN